jgi:hypothetical protein
MNNDRQQRVLPSGPEVPADRQKRYLVVHTIGLHGKEEVEVVAGDHEGFGPCVFRTEESAKAALERLRVKYSSPHFSNNFDKEHSIREISWLHSVH